jgi:hypothetical protein
MDTEEGMRTPESTVWPNDVVGLPRELERESPHRLVCFLLSPFEPREVFDPIHDAVATACGLCAQLAGVDIECRRADTLHEAKTVHDDIWRHIASADLLVVDVTGLNSNVMIELGVAAAMRRPTQVILIKAADDPSSLPFNAFAQRYLLYRRSILGDREFLFGLHKAMIQAITPAPYTPSALSPRDATGVHVDFQHGDRPDIVLSPGIMHRRRVKDCLEIGSFHVYRNSWLLLTSADYRNARVCIRFRFAALGKDPPSAFLGISLRNQHFHANWGHMVFLRADGRVIRTEPENDMGAYHNVDVGEIPMFKHDARKLIKMTATFTEEHLSLSVGPVKAQIPVSAMPYVYGAGKVRVSIAACRVHIREIELTPL